MNCSSFVFDDALINCTTKKINRSSFAIGSPVREKVTDDPPFPTYGMFDAEFIAIINRYLLSADVCNKLSREKFVV